MDIWRCKVLRSPEKKVVLLEIQVIPGPPDGEGCLCQAHHWRTTRDCKSYVHHYLSIRAKDGWQVLDASLAGDVLLKRMTFRCAGSHRTRITAACGKASMACDGCQRKMEWWTLVSGNPGKRRPNQLNNSQTCVSFQPNHGLCSRNKAFKTTCKLCCRKETALQLPRIHNHGESPELLASRPTCMATTALVLEATVTLTTTGFWGLLHTH